MGGLTYNKSNKQWLNECEKLIITNKDVIKAPMASMIEPRSQFSTALLKQRIYAFGGFSGEGKKSSKFAEFYDINSNIWYEINIPQSSILCESFCLQVSVVGNEEIVLLGGSDSNQLSGNVVKFNPTTMKIECLPSMNVKRAGFAVLEDNGCLYACYGGGPSGICCEKFEGGKWVLGREWVNDLAGYEEDDINVSDLISSHFKMFI
jgi:Kelch motif